jgi:spore germination cell wall hydrolase CwlJ-like protein
MRRRICAWLAGAFVVTAVMAGPQGSAFAAQFGLVDDSELECLALNIYFESRSEPRIGQVAVAHTTLNRVANEKFPDTVCGVVFQGGEKIRHKCQFSWWCDGRSDAVHERKAWLNSVRVAQLAMQKRIDDPTDGALFYHHERVNPNWSRVFELTTKIGKHLFYR